MGGDDGEANHFCLLHCLTEGSRERRKAKPKEENSSRCRSPTIDSTSGHTKYPITIVTMAMAVSCPPKGSSSRSRSAGGPANGSRAA